MNAERDGVISPAVPVLSAGKALTYNTLRWDWRTGEDGNKPGFPDTCTMPAVLSSPLRALRYFQAGLSAAVAKEVTP